MSDFDENDEMLDIDDADIPDSAFINDDEEPVVAVDINKMYEVAENGEVVDSETGEIIPVQPEGPRPYVLSPLPSARERAVSKVFANGSREVSFPAREDVACVGCTNATWFIQEQETKTGVQSRLMCKCHPSFKISYGGESKSQISACSEANYAIKAQVEGEEKPVAVKIFYADVKQDPRGQECVGCGNAMWHDVKPHDPLTSKRVFCMRLLFDVFGGDVKGAVSDCDGKKPSKPKLRPDGFLR